MSNRIGFKGFNVPFSIASHRKATSPDSMVFWRYSWDKDVIRRNSDGTVPVKAFILKTKSDSPDKIPSSLGSVPLK